MWVFEVGWLIFQYENVHMFTLNIGISLELCVEMHVLMGARSGLMPMFELKCVQYTYFHLKYRHQFMNLYEYIYVM